jgi:asparagine synthase (glutamine-hydrolysing)
MRKNGVVVTIDGHGADELFGGYNFDFLHILYDTMFNLKNSLAVIDTYYESTLQDGIQFKQLPPKSLFLLNQFVRNAGKKILRYKNKNIDDSHQKWKSLNYFTQKLYISFHQTVLPTLLRNYDRYSMINGVEIRMPFMDHRLVSYVFSLPWTSKLRNGYTKAIVRDSMISLMPAEVVCRKTKVGFNSPMVDWFKGPMKTFFADTISSQAFKDSSIIDSVVVKEQVLKVMNDSDSSFIDAVEAWKAISPYFWQEGFLNKVKNL